MKIKRVRNEGQDQCIHQRVRQAAFIFNSQIDMQETSEEKLAMAVLAKAIEDIGVRRYCNHRKAYIHSPANDSTWAWKSGALRPWVEILGIEWRDMRRIFKRYKLLPGGLP